MHKPQNGALIGLINIQIHITFIIILTFIVCKRIKTGCCLFFESYVALDFSILPCYIVSPYSVKYLLISGLNTTPKVSPKLKKTDESLDVNIIKKESVKKTKTDSEINGKQDTTFKLFNSSLSSTLIITKESSIEVSQKSIGFVGSDERGKAIMKNLLSTKHDVTLWGNKSEITDIVEQVKYTQEMEELTECSDIICWCLPDEGVSQMLFNKEIDYKDLLTPGKIFIDMTKSASPTFARRLFDGLHDYGAKYLEVRTYGTLTEEREGNLSIYAAGDSEAYEAFKSCLKAISKETYYLGSNVGSPSVFVLTLQVQKGLIIESTLENYKLIKSAIRTGIDYDKLLPYLPPLAGKYIQGLQCNNPDEESSNQTDIESLLDNDIFEKKKLSPPYVLCSLHIP